MKLQGALGDAQHLFLECPAMQPARERICTSLCFAEADTMHMYKFTVAGGLVTGSMLHLRLPYGHMARIPGMHIVSLLLWHWYRVLGPLLSLGPIQNRPN